MNLGIILIIMSFRFGYIPDMGINYGINMYEQQSLDLENTFLAEFAIDIIICRYIFIRGSLNNIFHRQLGLFAFSPDHDQYTITGGLQYEGLEIGLTHKCYHPIFPAKKPFGYNLSLLEGGYEEIYIKVTTKFEL